MGIHPAARWGALRRIRPSVAGSPRHDEDPGLVPSRARTTQEIVKPYDFVLAPILQTDDLDTEQRAEKPILITRFTYHSDEWLEW